MTYLICYDLNQPGKDYDKLIEKIKAIADGWWHHLDSTWIIRSELSAADIRDALKPLLDTNDELLVVKSSGFAAWTGFNDKGSVWLKENI